MLYNKKSELHSGGWIVIVNNTVLSERGSLRFHLTLKHVNTSKTERSHIPASSSGSSPVSVSIPQITK